MKNTLKAVGLTLSLIMAATVAFAGQQAYKLRVDGLSCPFCAYGIEKKLKAVKGVEKVDVDLKTGNVIATVVEGAVFDEATAKKAVTDAGFTLRGFEKIPAQETGK
jgi:mercuric ion binding protein